MKSKNKVIILIVILLMLACLPALVACDKNSGENENNGNGNAELNIKVEFGMNSCLIKWNKVSGAADYEVKYNNVTAKIVDASQTQYRFDVADSFFTVKVYARNASGLVITNDYIKCEASGITVDTQTYDVLIRDNRHYITWDAVSLTGEGEVSGKYSVIINDEENPISVDKNEVDITNYGEINKFAVKSADVSEIDGKIVFMKYNEVKAVRFFDESLVKNMVVKYSDNYIYWDKVENASKYLVTVKDRDGNVLYDDVVVSTQLYINAAEFDKGNFSVSVKPVASAAENNVVYLGMSSSVENVFKYGEGVDSASMKIENGRLSWREVIGCASYTVSGTCKGADGNVVKVNETVRTNSYKLSMDSSYVLAVDPNYSDPKIYSAKSTDLEFTVLSAPVIVCEKSGSSMVATWDVSPLLKNEDVKVTDFTFTVTNLVTSDVTQLTVTEYKVNGFKVSFNPSAGDYKLNCYYAGNYIDVYTGAQVDTYVKKLEKPEVTVSYLANELKSYGTSSGYKYSDVQLSCVGNSDTFGFRNNGSVAYSDGSYIFSPTAIYETVTTEFGVFTQCDADAISRYNTADIAFNVVLDSDDLKLTLRQKAPLSNVVIRTDSDSSYYFGITSGTDAFVNYFLDGDSGNLTGKNSSKDANTVTKIMLEELVGDYVNLASGEHNFYVNTGNISLSSQTVTLKADASNVYHIPTVYKQLNFKKYAAPSVSFDKTVGNSRTILINNSSSISESYSYGFYMSDNGISFSYVSLTTDRYFIEDLSKIGDKAEYYAKINGYLSEKDNKYYLVSDASERVYLKRAEAPQYLLTGKQLAVSNWQNGCNLILSLTDGSQSGQSIEKIYSVNTKIDLEQLYRSFKESGASGNNMTVNLSFVNVDSQNPTLFDSNAGKSFTVTKVATPTYTLSGGILKLTNNESGYSVELNVTVPTSSLSTVSNTVDLNEYFKSVQGGNISFTLRYTSTDDTVLSSDVANIELSKADTPTVTVKSGVLKLGNNSQNYNVEISVSYQNVNTTVIKEAMTELDLNSYFSNVDSGQIKLGLTYRTQNDAMLDSCTVSTTVTKAAAPLYSISNGKLTLSNNDTGYTVELAPVSPAGDAEQLIGNTINLNDRFASVQNGEIRFRLRYLSGKDAVLNSNQVEISIAKASVPQYVIENGILKMTNYQTGYSVELVLVTFGSETETVSSNTIDLNKRFESVKSGEIKFKLRYLPATNMVLNSDYAEITVTKASAPEYTIENGVLTLSNKVSGYTVELMPVSPAGSTETLTGDSIDLNARFAGISGEIKFKLRYLSGTNIVLNSDYVEISLTKASAPAYTIENSVLELSNNSGGYSVEMTVTAPSMSTVQVSSDTVNLNKYFSEVSGGNISFELKYKGNGTTSLDSEVKTVSVSKLNAVERVVVEGNEVSFTGTASTYIYRVDGGEWVSVYTTEFTLPAELQQGDHTIEIVATGDGVNTLDSNITQTSFQIE